MTNESFKVKTEKDNHTIRKGGYARENKDNKIDWSLAIPSIMPMKDNLFGRLARHLQNAQKPNGPYESRNYEKIEGDEARQEAKISAFRHFIAWYFDETDEDHQSALLFNVGQVLICDWKKEQQELMDKVHSSVEEHLEKKQTIGPEDIDDEGECPTFMLKCEGEKKGIIHDFHNPNGRSLYFDEVMKARDKKNLFEQEYRIDFSKDDPTPVLNIQVDGSMPAPIQYVDRPICFDKTSKKDRRIKNQCNECNYCFDEEGYGCFELKITGDIKSKEEEDDIHKN